MISSVHVSTSQKLGPSHVSPAEWDLMNPMNLATPRTVVDMPKKSIEISGAEKFAMKIMDLFSKFTRKAKKLFRTVK